MSEISISLLVGKLEEEAGGKRVLLVEGSTDIRILSYFLEKVSPGWNTQIELLLVGKKYQVINVISKYHPEWVGIVDKDEWSPDYVEKTLQNIPRVKILPRFCLENYFCVPEELWTALQPNARHSLDNDVNRLQQPLLDALPDWIVHGAMWRVIRRRHTVLVYESKFPSEFDSKPITDENEIRRILETWQNQLNPDQILHEYHEELTEANSRTVYEKLAKYVHGKKFFRQVVVQTLNELFGQANPDTWLERFSQDPSGLMIPDDLSGFLLEVLDLLFVQSGC